MTPPAEPGPNAALDLDLDLDGDGDLDLDVDPVSRQDVHVHTTFSDDADASSTPAACVAAAGRLGLRRICLSDHVRRDTGWLPDLVAALEALRPTTDVEILTGVEAKILDDTGRLDVPAALPPLDRLLVADHQFPGAGGPETPAEVTRALLAGETDPAAVVDRLAEATARALEQAATRCERPVLAHLFSLLPKIGRSEDDVADGPLDRLVAAAAATGAILDVNEKWTCPSARVVARFLAGGVEVAPGSDAHHVRDVGRHPRADRVIARARRRAVPLRTR